MREGNEILCWAIRCVEKISPESSMQCIKDVVALRLVKLGHDTPCRDVISAQRDENT